MNRSNKVFISKSFIFLVIVFSTFFARTSFSKSLDKGSIKLLSETFTFSSTDVKMKNIKLKLEPQKISQKLSFSGDMLVCEKTINDSRYIYKVKLSNLNPQPRSFTYNDNFTPRWYLLKYRLLQNREHIEIKNGKEHKKRMVELHLSYYGDSLDTAKILSAFSSLISQSMTK